MTQRDHFITRFGDTENSFGRETKQSVAAPREHRIAEQSCLQAAKTSYEMVSQTFDQRKTITGYDHPFNATVAGKRILNPQGQKPYTELTLSIPNIGAIAMPGDAIGIWVENPAEDAAQLLTLGGWDGDAPITLTESHPGWHGETTTTHHTTLATALRKHLDIITPRREWLEAIADATLADGATPIHHQRQQQLKRWLAEDPATLERLQATHRLADILRLIPAQITPQQLSDTTWQLDQRRFTLSAIDADSISIISSPIRYWQKRPPLFAGDVGEERFTEGTFTKELRQLEAGQIINLYLDPKSFGLPWKPMENTPTTTPEAARHTPMIMVGAGTGLAPYLPMLHELEKLGHQGKTWLIIGNKSAISDQLYHDQLQAFQQNDTLSRYDFAASADPENPRYVQHVLQENAAELTQWVANGAEFYLCGDRVMANAVKQLLDELGLLEKLEASGRLHEDSYRQSQEFQNRAPQPIHTPCLVLGSGPAGSSAALYAARLGLEPIMLSGPKPIGQLELTQTIENYPGFEKPILATSLMEQMQAQALSQGARRIYGSVSSANLSERPFTITLEDGTSIVAESLIIATGSTPRSLGVEGESRLRGYGVSNCAVCDGPFFRGKPVAVVGGGDAALEEALQLNRMGAQVTLIHWRDQLRASNHLQQQLFAANPPITIRWNEQVTAIHGEKQVESLSLKNLLTGESSTLPLAGVFVAIGHDPESSLFKNQLSLDPQGHIRTFQKRTRTSLPGVFAAGDVADPIYRQAITSAGQGAAAAIDASHYLQERAIKTAVVMEARSTEQRSAA